MIASTSCPKCGAPLKVCLGVFIHFDVVVGPDGAVSLKPTPDEDHDDGIGTLRCTACEWSDEDVETGDVPLLPNGTQGDSMDATLEDAQRPRTPVTNTALLLRNVSAILNQDAEDVPCFDLGELLSAAISYGVLLRGGEPEDVILARQDVARILREAGIDEDSAHGLVLGLVEGLVERLIKQRSS